MATRNASATTIGAPFSKPTLVRGRPARIDCIEIGGQTFTISGGPLAILGLEDEWYEDVVDPLAVIDRLRSLRRPKPDLFTFWQRIPDVDVRYPFHHEWEQLAALPITSHEAWWKTQISAKTRNRIRKAEKEGLVVRETPFDDDFVRGMTGIFNETPVRQGRVFWHYGKDNDTVRAEFSRFLHREHLIGAYIDQELAGFVFLGNAGRFGILHQIVSSLQHRNKSVNNALMSRAVEVCARRRLGHLVYAFWTDDSLSDFKKHCGFAPVRVPRYYVPLTWRGALALNCGAHRGWKAMLPDGVRDRLKQLRTKWYAHRAGGRA
jgi:hypothetical protein